MHLIVIIAFASLLWFKPSGDHHSDREFMNFLALSPRLSILVMVSQTLAVVVASLAAARSCMITLQKSPDDPNPAQSRYHFFVFLLQTTSLGFFLGNLTLTDWPRLVNAQIGRGLWFGLPDLVILSPFLIHVMLVWIVFYPVDRAIRRLAHPPRLEQGTPVHAVWSFGSYLSFNVRYQILTVAVPLTLIVIGDDAIDHYHHSIVRFTHGLWWAPDVLMGALVGVVFLWAPVMLRYIWKTQPIPSGELRTKLELLGRRIPLRYRELLIWHSGGMVVNAAVMGLIAPLRYVVISDGLLETLSDRQIESVFGHEAGHIKHKHIPYFILFSILTMLMAGGLVWGLDHLHLTRRLTWLRFEHIQLTAGGFVLMMWGLGFGRLSHLFEHQADLAGAQAISGPDFHQPDQPACSFPQAAEEFGLALQRVAALNGIPSDERGWRHPSIYERVVFLRQMAENPVAYRSFANRVRMVKLFLWILTGIGLCGAAYLYGPYLIPPTWWS